MAPLIRATIQLARNARNIGNCIPVSWRDTILAPAYMRSLDEPLRDVILRDCRKHRRNDRLVMLINSIGSAIPWLAMPVVYQMFPPAGQSVVAAAGPTGQAIGTYLVAQIPYWMGKTLSTRAAAKEARQVAETAGKKCREDRAKYRGDEIPQKELRTLFDSLRFIERDVFRTLRDGARRRNVNLCAASGAIGASLILNPWATVMALCAIVPTTLALKPIFRKWDNESTRSKQRHQHYQDQLNDKESRLHTPDGLVTSRGLGIEDVVQCDLSDINGRMLAEEEVRFSNANKKLLIGLANSTWMWMAVAAGAIAFGAHIPVVVTMTAAMDWVIKTIASDSSDKQAVSETLSTYGQQWKRLKDANEKFSMVWPGREHLELEGGIKEILVGTSEYSASGDALVIKHGDGLSEPISFAMYSGVTLLIGPSGGGKSRLLEVLAGYIAPITGDYKLTKHNYSELDVIRQCDPTSLPKYIRLISPRTQLSVDELLRTYCIGNNGEVDKLQATNQLRRVGFKSHKAIEIVHAVCEGKEPQLSTGQRRRIPLLSLLEENSRDIEIFLLDELGMNFDEKTCILYADLVNEIADRGKFVVAAAHTEIPALLKISDYVLHINETGGLVGTGPIEWALPAEKRTPINSAYYSTLQNGHDDHSWQLLDWDRFRSLTEQEVAQLNETTQFFHRALTANKETYERLRLRHIVRRQSIREFDFASEVFTRDVIIDGEIRPTGLSVSPRQINDDSALLRNLAILKGTGLEALEYHGERDSGTLELGR